MRCGQLWPQIRKARKMSDKLDIGDIVVHKDKFVSEYLYANCKCLLVGITKPGPFMTSRGGLAVVDVWGPNGELKTILHTSFSNLKKLELEIGVGLA